MDYSAMMGMLHQSMAQAREFEAVDDPETTATKIRDNDSTLRSLVIGPILPDSLSCVIQKRLPPERYLPESTEEWRSVGEQIGAHSHIEEFEMYDLKYESLRDLGALLSGVANNRSIRIIRFHNTNIGRSEINDIAPLLANNTNLRKLDVNACCINDPFLALAPILESSTLEEFKLMRNEFPRSFTTDGLEDIERCLCDATSIDTTYQSNHKLFNLAVYNETDDGMSERLVDLPTKLKESLKLNKNSNKEDVAREKILRSHFSGKFSLEPFEEDCMDRGVLPFFLSWLGRTGLEAAPDEQTVSLMTGRITSSPGGENMCSQSVMFEFLRRMHQRLFESDSGKGRKRQRTA